MNSFSLPLRVVSEANVRQHWAVKAKRVKAQRQAVAWAWRAAGLPNGRFPAAVRIVRLAPRKLDTDNLARACKAVRDQIAAECGFDDREDVWSYAQESGAYGIRVEVSW